MFIPMESQRPGASHVTASMCATTCAIANYDEAIKINPKDAALYFRRGWTGL